MTSIVRNGVIVIIYDSGDTLQYTKVAASLTLKYYCDVLQQTREEFTEGDSSGDTHRLYDFVTELEHGYRVLQQQEQQ